MIHKGVSRSVSRTSAGCVRSQNQDCVHMDDSQGLWMITDGMGGNFGGEIASRLAIDVILESLAGGADVEQALHAAHARILRHGTEHPETEGLGTTVVLVQDEGDRYRFAWVGDSRIYRWRDARLEQLSEDHGVVQRMVNAGLLSPENARNHPQRNLITSCLGGDQSFELEIGCLEEVWRRGDRLLLCSDGLNDELDDEALAAILSLHGDAESCADALLQAALEAGGRDNVSIALIDAPPGATSPGLFAQENLRLGAFGLIGAIIALALVLLFKYLR